MFPLCLNQVELALISPVSSEHLLKRC